MQVNGVFIENTFAEAFKMRAARLLVTAINPYWVTMAANAATGFATSVIGCGCEAGIEEMLDEDKTPDGRPGANLLFFAMSRDELEKQLSNRIGQGIMTAATAACYNNLVSEEMLNVGGKLRFFGDGYQKSKRIDHRRFWRIPVMSGEFLLEEKFGVQKAVGGGNFLILGESLEAVLASAEAAVDAIKAVRNVIMPFPGGIVSSGSKVGSKYSFLSASTNSEYCPTMSSRVETKLPEGVNSVMEIVIDGLNVEAVEEAMKVGIKAACRPGIIKITAGNYGGNLGQFNINLHEVMR